MTNLLRKHHRCDNRRSQGGQADRGHLLGAVGAGARMCPWPWVGTQHLMKLSSLSFEIGCSSGEELACASEYEMGGSPVQTLLCCLIAGLGVA